MRAASILRTAVGTRRAPVWLGMAAIVALSWLYLGRMGGGMVAMGGVVSAHAGMAMGGADAHALALAFAMWAVMMMAMMLPTVAPSASMFSTLEARRAAGGSNTATALYVAGYAASWVAFAIAAALAQWGLTQALLLDPMARSTNALLSSGILLAAGIYQWTPLKNACLAKCRTPLAFFMAKWRDGAAGAFVLGLQHGGYCVACCWALMAVMFVVGAMSLGWMAVFMLLVLGEKLLPVRLHFDRAIGAVLVVSGMWVAAGAWPGP